MKNKINVILLTACFITLLALSSEASVTLVAPNGGESLLSNSVYPITWRSSTDAVKFNVLYSLDNGTTWKLIQSNVAAKKLLWTVPNVAANKTMCLIRVAGFTSSGAAAGIDKSNAPFSITTSQTTRPVTVSKVGSGTVTSSPVGINCGTDCVQNYAGGSTVTLTATAAADTSFTGWTGCNSTNGATCTLSMNMSKVVTATFKPLYTLTVSMNGTGSGTVMSSSAGINCGVDCTEPYVSGTNVTLTASPSPGSAFAGWTGCTSATNSCTVSMTSSKSVTAMFNTASTTGYFYPDYDNAVMTSSLNNYDNTVFQNYTLPVGINWSYNYLPWPADMWVQDYLVLQSLLHFNLNSLSGKTIDSASLRLTTRTSSLQPADQWHIWAVASPWNTATVTWSVVNNANFLHYTGYMITLDPPYSGQIYNIDLTPMVQAWASGIWSNYGLLFGTEGSYVFPYTTSWEAFEFFSNEDTTDLKPMLTVTYH